jgi:hypothetical protein
VAPLEAALTAWRDRLTRRSRAMLAAAGELDTYLTRRESASR